MSTPSSPNIEYNYTPNRPASSDAVTVKTNSVRTSGQFYPAPPRWWRPEHTSAWERVKEALRRDWEQTKADFSNDAGHELNQDLVDTVKQATGVEEIPPRNMPNPELTDVQSWELSEPAVRYGFSARTQYQATDKWDDKLESTLQHEWEGFRTGRTWMQVRNDVRRGWEYARQS